MTDTEFKMLIDLMATMTEAGKWAFIWWLVASKLTGFVTGMTLIAVAAFVILRAVAMISATDEDSNAMRRIGKEVLGMSMSYYGHAEREMVVEKVIEIVNAQRDMKKK